MDLLGSYEIDPENRGRCRYMKRTTEFLKHAVTRTDRDDGTILLTSDYTLGPVTDRTGDWLHNWADKAGDRVFIAERSGAGWREESYTVTLPKVRAIASSLLARGMGQVTPILIMSGNGVDHGLLTLAAQYVGVPTVPVAEQYSLITGAHERLQHAIELVRPKMAYVIDAEQYAAAIVHPGINSVKTRCCSCQLLCIACKREKLIYIRVYKIS